MGKARAHDGDPECRGSLPAPTPKSEAKSGDIVKPHSIKLPTNYRKAIKYVQMAVEDKRNINELLDKDKHFRTGRTIVGRVLTNLSKIDAICAKFDLATKEPALKPWIARVLVSELLFGSRRLVGNAPAVECVRKYEEELRKLKTEMENLTEEFTVPRFVRVNRLEISIPDAKKLLAELEWNLVEESFDDYRSFLSRVKTLGEFEYIVDFHFPDVFVFPSSARRFWGASHNLRDQFVLQNKACLLATYLLRPSKKSVVLDMCAAPGMKTTHLATLMNNKGRIYAVERDAKRYEILTKLVGSYGVIKTINSDCLDVTDEQVPGVQYILVDPSCSGSGMLNRTFEREQPIDEQRLYRLGGLQYKLLSHAMNAFPNARRIVYSTCSIYVQENEQVVQSVLRHNAHFRLLDARQELGKEWLNVGSPDFVDVGERCLYARTQDDLTIGMFVAVFERCPEGVQNELYTGHEKQKESYSRFARIKQKQAVEGNARTPAKMNGKQAIIAEVNNDDWRPEAPFAGKRKAAETKHSESKKMRE